MPNTSSTQREMERARRRRHLRRQRQAVGLAVVLIAAALSGLGLFLSDRGRSAKPVATKSTQTQKRALPVRPAAARSALRRQVRSLVRAVEKRVQAGERIALERFAAKGQPLYCGGSTGHYVALTFDDGPGAYTEMALGILGDTPATFFLIGRNVRERGGNVLDELRHFSAVGIHTWSHVSLVGLEPAEVRSQIERTAREIAEETNTTTRLVRPPYGNHDATVDRILRRMGIVDVLWSVDGGDSQGKDWQGIGREVLDNVRPGSIVLLHENRGQTIRALHRIILPGLKKKGLIPVTIPELLILDPPPQATSRCG
jgi:peptidoglycan/xylan/chitin deacetylase (PgdA/CDA1 family)